MDYQIGEDIKEKIIPRAIDYFTGKALEYDMMEDDDDDYEDLDDEDEDEDEDFDDEVRFCPFLNCSIHSPNDATLSLWPLFSRIPSCAMLTDQ